MISQQFEREIMRGNAEAKELNISESVFNYNVGRHAGVIIEHITIQPFFLKISEIAISSAGDVINKINEFISENYLFTINVYGNSEEKNLTIKQQLKFTTIDTINQTTILIATSGTQYTQNLFWNFKGENLTFELTDVKDTINQIVNPIIQPYQLGSKRVNNPTGFELPNPTIVQYTGGTFDWNTANMGKQNTTILPGATGTTQSGFIIPRNGNGVTGNVITRGNGSLANAEQMILNVGLIIYKQECTNNII